MAIVTTDDKHYKNIADVMRSNSVHHHSARFQPWDMSLSLQTIFDDCCGRDWGDGYTYGFEQGEEQGYDDGYDEGQNDGWELGYQTGYDDGEGAGWNLGEQAEYDRLWDSLQQNGDRRNHMYAFAGAAWDGNTFKPKHPIRFNDTSETTRHAMCTFTYFGWGSSFVLDLSTIDIDFSGCKTLTNTFANAQVNNIYIDGSNLATMTGTFNRADTSDKTCLTDVTLKITDKCYNFNNTFAHCRGLVNLTIEEGSVIGANLDLSATTVITKESLLDVIDALKNYSGTGTTHTLTLGSTNLAKLSEADKAIATQKGWTLA